MSTLTQMVAVALSLGLILIGTAAAQESEVMLKEGSGKDKAMQCAGCHSLDYIQMNSRFMNKAGWSASVAKMINVFGAPIPKRRRGDHRELPRSELRQAYRQVVCDTKSPIGTGAGV